MFKNININKTTKTTTTTTTTLITATGIMATTSNTNTNTNTNTTSNSKTNNFSEEIKDELYQQALSMNLKELNEWVDILISKLEDIAKTESKIQFYSRIGIKNKELAKPDQFLDSKVQRKLIRSTRELSREVSCLSRPIIELKLNIRNIHCLISQRNFNHTKGQLELKVEDFNKYFILEDILIKLSLFISNFENYNNKKRILCCCRLVHSLCNLLEAFDRKGKSSKTTDEKAKM